MKRRFLTLAMSFSLLFSACSVQSDNETEHDNSSGEEAAVSYNGTELIYAIPYEYEISESAVLHLNSYLEQQGKPYYVTFLPVEFDDFGMQTDYAEKLEKLLQSDQNIDIFYTGSVKSNYDYFIENGYLLDLTDYLNSDEGKAFYESLPPDRWQTASRNGRIYGASGYIGGYITPRCYLVNRSLMEKYGFTEKDFNCPLSEMEEMFKTVKEGEGKDFYPLLSHIEFDISSFYSISKSVGIDRSTNTPQLLSGNEEYMAMTEALYDFFAKDYFRQNNGADIDNFLVYYSSETEVPMIPGLGNMYSGDRPIDENDLIVIPVDNGHWYQLDLKQYTAVNAETENKDYALDFLTTAFTDRTVTDLLLLGVEGEDYVIENGKVDNEHSSLRLDVVFGNSFICTTKFFEYENKTELYFEFHEKLQPDPLAGFEFDPTGYEDIIAAADEAIGKITSMLDGIITFDEMKAAIDEAMEDAGADELLAEIDRQLAEYLGESNE